MKELRAELARVGIRGRLARRIELELADHLRCNPDANLGEPRLIAERFADELRLPRTRRATYGGFGALALAAVLLTAMQRALKAAGGFPDLTSGRGTVAALAGLAIVVAGQVAFVAGVLALWRTLLGGSTPEDLRLVQRRLGLALGAGVLVALGEGVQAVALQPLLPAWWFALAVAASAVPLVAFGTASSGLRGAVALTPHVPAAAHPFRRRHVLAVGAFAVLAITVGSAFAEHSWVEGLSRGALEAFAFGACFAAFGRYLGIRR